MSRTAWRVAGLFAIGHVVLVLVGITQQNSLRLGDDAAAVATEYVHGDLTRTFAGGYVETLVLLLLLPVIAFLVRAVGQNHVSRILTKMQVRDRTQAARRVRGL